MKSLKSPKSKSSNKPDIYEQMHNDHIVLRQNLRQFRKHPSHMSQHLRNRLKRYKKVKDQTFLFSNQHKNKAVRLSQDQDPQQRIQQLIQILDSTPSPLGQTIQISRLYQCASKICQTIVLKIPQQINFKPQTASQIRKIIESDDNIIFPNQIKCLVSISFNQQYQPLMTLLVDDDLMQRPNRQVLLNPQYKYFGICSAIPTGNQHLKCTVYLLTDKAQRKSDPDNIISFESTSNQYYYKPTYKQTKFKRIPEQLKQISDIQEIPSNILVLQKQKQTGHINIANISEHSSSQQSSKISRKYDRLEQESQLASRISIKSKKQRDNQQSKISHKSDKSQSSKISEKSQRDNESSKLSKKSNNSKKYDQSQKMSNKSYHSRENQSQKLSKKSHSSKGNHQSQHMSEKSDNNSEHNSSRVSKKSDQSHQNSQFSKMSKKSDNSQQIYQASKMSKKSDHHHLQQHDQSSKISKMSKKSNDPRDNGHNN